MLEDPLLLMDDRRSLVEWVSRTVSRFENGSMTAETASRTITARSMGWCAATGGAGTGVSGSGDMGFSLSFLSLSSFLSCAFLALSDWSFSKVSHCSDDHPSSSSQGSSRWQGLWMMHCRWGSNFCRKCLQVEHRLGGSLGGSSSMVILSREIKREKKTLG